MYYWHVIVRGRKTKTRWKEVMRMQKCPANDGDLTRQHWSANESYDCGMNRGKLLCIYSVYTASRKTQDTQLFVIILARVNQFSEFCYWRIFHELQIINVARSSGMLQNLFLFYLVKLEIVFLVLSGGRVYIVLYQYYYNSALLINNCN